jgi:hypothetical protein
VKVEFSHNNSGGRWWLKDKDWKALEKAGWTVDWFKDQRLGALASNASKDFPTLKAAVEEWEKVTGQDFFDEGCNCCGSPFSMYATRGKKYEFVSGDSVDREVVRPW